MNITRPPRVKRGDAIGIISPSAPAAGKFPYRRERSCRALEKLGFVPIISPHALSVHGHVSASAQERAADLHTMIENPRVTAIIAAIGGDHSCQLLPHIDFDLIRRNPKCFVGYSDNTVLCNALTTTGGVVTFYGPTLMTEFAEFPEPPEYTISNFLNTLCVSSPQQLSPAPEWIDEFIPWGDERDFAQKRPTKAEPWRWTRKGRASGPLFGGCIESLQHLRGTSFWPPLAGAILFLETSSSKPDIPHLDSILSDYENMGVWEEIAGLVFGRTNWPIAARGELIQLLERRTSAYGFPILAGVDFGHVSPMATLPLGCLATIDSVQERFSIDEAAVR